jgi:hypothetical protein
MAGERGCMQCLEQACKGPPWALRSVSAAHQHHRQLAVLCCGALLSFWSILVSTPA